MPQTIKTGCSCSYHKIIYDGSKVPKGSGIGVFGLKMKYFDTMANFPSFFQAKIYEIGRCARLNLDRKLGTIKIEI